MNTKNTDIFKTRLEKEKKLLEGELATVGKSDKRASTGWDATAGGIQVDAADENELADKMEELEDNEGIVQQLTKQLNEVKGALEKIQKGTFGICTVCGKEIESDRLEANPSAVTCKKDMK